MVDSATPTYADGTRFRSLVSEALVGIVDAARDELVAITDIYDAVEARFAPLLNRSRDPDRESEEVWRHDVRWELETAVVEGRLIRRADLGRGIYTLPSAGEHVRWDVVVSVPRDIDADWTTMDWISIPGKINPRDLQPGSHLWIRTNKRLAHRAVVTGVERRAQRTSDIDGRDFGPGYIAHVEGWVDVDLIDAEIGAPGRWGQARLRYLDPATLQLRRGTPAEPSTRWTGPVIRRARPVIAQPSSEPIQWREVEHHLLADWSDWAAATGRDIAAATITTGDGTTLVTDAYDRTNDVLVEAKGSSSRMAVRLAIGQILDYSHHLRTRHRLAILLPDQPSRSIAAVANAAGIGFIFRDAAGFIEQLVDRG